MERSLPSLDIDASGHPAPARRSTLGGSSPDVVGTGAAPNDGAPIDVVWRRGRLVGRLLGGFLLFVGMALAALASQADPFKLVAFAAGALLFLSSAVTSARRLIASGAPALTIAADGLRSATRIEGCIPWHAIQDVMLQGTRRVSLLHMVVRAPEASAIKRSLPQRIGLGKANRLVFDVRAMAIDGPSLLQLIAARSRDAWDDGYARARAEESSVARALARRPFFAYGLIAVLSAILAAEFALRVRPAERDASSLDTLTLWGLGALQRVAVVKDGQVWRLFTAPLLHGSVTHLLFNALALWFAARLLERVIGWRWFAAVFAVSALSGALLSLALDPVNTVGVGASGGIVGLAAATALVALRFTGAVRSAMLVGGLRIVVPALLPLIGSARTASVKGTVIDVAAHAGGAIGGALVALALLGIWRAGRATPPFRGLAAGVAASFFLVAAGSLVPILGTYATAKATAALAPNVPNDLRRMVDQSPALVARYPRDPRVRAAHAEWLVAHDDVAGAERDLRAALADPAMLVPDVTTVEPYLRVRLAQLLIADGDRDEAHRVVRPACGTPSRSLRNAIDAMGACR